MHVAENGIISFFLWLSTIPLDVCTTRPLSVSGRLGCFRVLAIVCGAAVNTGECVSFGISLLQVHAQEWACWVLWLCWVLAVAPGIFVVSGGTFPCSTETL